MAQETVATKPKPLMKWVGGKRRVLSEILKYVPEEYTRYYEPFLGGGAVALHLQPAKATLTDVNPELINLYTVVKTSPEELIKELGKASYSNDKESYLRVRALDRSVEWKNSASPVERAARTIYLNRTGFNGLYRVNSKAEFNVPFGSYASPTICDSNNIRAVNKLWNSPDVTIKLGGFHEVLAEVEGTQNFIYCDPPYVPLTATSSFTSYTADGFGSDQQLLLAEQARLLDEKGNYVLLSNSDTKATRELYKDFIVKPISVRRSVGAGAESRKNVGEVLVLGKTLAELLQITESV